MEDYALIIGIEHYEDQSSLRPLQGATNDAKEIYAWMTSQDGGNIKPENCTLLLSEEGFTKLFQKHIEEELVKVITKARAKQNESRRFYFYFSGHGLGVSLSNVSLLVTDWQELLAHRGISSKLCQESILEAGIFDEILFFLDCCRSRKININPQGGRIWTPGTNPRAKKTQAFTAYATTHWDVAYEDDIEDENGITRHSYFTKALLNGLKGEAADKDSGEITLALLKGHLKDETYELAQMNGRRQIVKFEHTFDSEDAVIARVPQIGNTVLSHNICINFSDNTSGPFIIEDGSLNQIGSWTKQQGEWKVKLDPGLYLLTDQGTNESMSLKIKTLMTEIKHVKF